MSSFTPQFDQALEVYYKTVRAGIQTCQETGEVFEITPAEYDLYRSLGLPLPRNTPQVRFRRQRAHLGGLDLFERSRVGNDRLITMYDPESPVIVLPTKMWYADTFDALKFGRPYDSERSFFEQWAGFSRAVPRPSTIHDLVSVNSDWCAYDIASKDCYLTHGGVGNEGVLYSDFCVQTKQCVDSVALVTSEWCYEAVQCAESSHVFFSERCDNCLNVYFSFGCQSCTDCFGCTNLRNKQFCFFNEQLTESDYRTRLAAIDLTDSAVVQTYRSRLHEMVRKAPHQSGVNYVSENVSGDDLVSCQDVTGVSIFEANHVYTAFDASYVKYCTDITTSSYLERSANSIAATNGYENKMVSTSEGCCNVEYSELCFSSENCFGCIGLRHKQFCIFNKQYTEAEYWRLVDSIKTDMLRRGEYGEFFPYSTSLFAYNTSHADALYPLPPTTARSLGARWYEGGSTTAHHVETLPDKLGDFNEVLIGKPLLPRVGERSFKIIKPEYDFHRTIGVALPTQHPTERRKKRLQAAWPFHLTARVCSSCAKKISTRVDDLGVPVFCEACYADLLGGAGNFWKTSSTS